MCHQTHRRGLLLAAGGAYPRTMANTDLLYRRLRDEALGDLSAQPTAVAWSIAWAPAPHPVGVPAPEREREVVTV